MPQKNHNVKEIFSHGKPDMVGDASNMPMPIVFTFHLNLVVLQINSETEILNGYTCIINYIFSIKITLSGEHIFWLFVY